MVPAHILVVDDELPIRRLLRSSLSERGYRVTTVASGQEGLDIAAADPPALIILDLGLPDIDGLEICERLRAESEVPILILSAYGFEWEAELLGAQGYIPKSVGMDEILERVRKAAGPPPLRH